LASNLNRWLIVAVIILLASGCVLTLWAARSEESRLRRQLLTETSLAGQGITTENIAALSGSEADLTSPEYLQLKEQMTRIRATDPLIRFAYLMGQRRDGTVFFIVDSEGPDSENYSPPGEVYTEASDVLRQAFLTGNTTTEGPLSDRWGTWVSGFVPLRDAGTKSVIAVFGMDVDARDWNRQIAMACTPAVAGTLLFLVLVLTFFLVQKRNEHERQLLEASEAAVRRSEEQYRMLFSKSPVGIVQVDEHGVIVIANQKFADIIGMPVEQLTGIDLLSSVEDPGMVAAIRDTLAGKIGYYEGDYTSVLTGKKSILRIIGQPVGTKEDGHFEAMGIVEDITERRQMEEALRQTKDFLQNLIKYANAPIIVWNPKFRIIEFNHAFEVLTGIARDTVIGQPLDILFTDETRKTSLSLIRSTLSGERWDVVEIPIRHVSGETRTVLWNSANILNPEGSIIATIAQGQDITERKRVEDALFQANRKLNLLNSITRHDILNLLMALRSYIELSRDSAKDNPDLSEFIAKEEAIAQNIEDQIRFTGDYQEMGVKKPSWQNINEIVIRTKELLPMRDVRIDVDKKDLDVLADPLLEKVFYNLFDNALRYGGDHLKTIRVFSNETGTGLVIVCEDDGAGLGETEKKHLFKRGFGKHTGLGLFLSKEILSITGITIEETSTSGKGARFEMHVPFGKFRWSQGNTAG
jgi:PAS domain S-box-containing protein